MQMMPNAGDMGKEEVLRGASHWAQPAFLKCGNRVTWGHYQIEYPKPILRIRSSDTGYVGTVGCELSIYVDKLRFQSIYIPNLSKI